jgi:F-type H+-transporting ATPase subunit epsilon
MARTFKAEIVTPERVVFSEEIESLVVPAERGYLGVLAGHAPLLCTLQPGEITIRRAQGESRYAMSGGFLEVLSGKAILLTESAEEIGKIDAERAGKSELRARERIASPDKAVDRERARAALERARNRLRLAARRKK